MQTGPQLRVSSVRLEEPWVQGEWFIHNTTPTPPHMGFVWEGVSPSAAGGLPDWMMGEMGIGTKMIVWRDWGH